jgi:hypothetical protein
MSRVSANRAVPIEVYATGTILVWKLRCGPGLISSQRAEEMAGICSELDLGSSSATPCGLTFEEVYFDLLLSRPMPALEIKLLFALAPEAY